MRRCGAIPSSLFSLICKVTADLDENTDYSLILCAENMICFPDLFTFQIRIFFTKLTKTGLNPLTSLYDLKVLIKVNIRHFPGLFSTSLFYFLPVFSSIL